MSASPITFSRRAHSKTERAVIVLFGFLVGCVSRGDETVGWKDRLGISGTARSSYFTKGNSFVDNPGVQCDSVWLTAKPPEWAGVQTYWDARVQSQLVNGNSKLRGDLREGYFEKTVGSMEFKLGRQIIVWGRADKINPTDAWSIRDYKLLVTDDDDQRIGATALQATWSVAAGRFIMVWQPEFRFPVLPIPPQASGEQPTSIAAAPRAAQAGVKFDHTGDGVDWSVSFAHAINRTPDLVLLPRGDSTAPARHQVGLAYNFAETVGADAAVPVGRFGFRGEVAYVHARNDGGQNPLAQDSALFAVVGVERTWAGELNVNVQYLFKRSFDYRGSDAVEPSIRPIASAARLISNQLAATMEGASLRINYKAFNETLETEISGAMWFKKADSFVQAKCTYAFNDRIKGIVGADIWSGPVDSFFGRLRHSSAAFVELRFGL